MAIRYVGDATVYIFFDKCVCDRCSYKGKIVVEGHSWSFDELQSPAYFNHAADSPKAYDEMAGSAASFGSYYSSLNRGDDTPDWAPSPEAADAIEEAVSWAQDEDGEYKVRRKK